MDLQKLHDAWDKRIRFDICAWQAIDVIKIGIKEERRQVLPRFFYQNLYLLGSGKGILQNFGHEDELAYLNFDNFIPLRVAPCMSNIPLELRDTEKYLVATGISIADMYLPAFIKQLEDLGFVEDFELVEAYIKMEKENGYGI